MKLPDQPDALRVSAKPKGEKADLVEDFDFVSYSPPFKRAYPRNVLNSYGLYKKEPAGLHGVVEIVQRLKE